MRGLVWIGLGAIGCAQEKVIDEMERSLAASNVAIAQVLVATEILSHTHDVPDATLRHPGGTTFGCPGVVDKLGSDDNFALTLDYADLGCVPDSALVPAALSGHAGLLWSGTEATASWDGLHVDLDNAVSGTLSGPVEPMGTDLALTARGTLTVGPSTADLDVDVLFTNDGVTFDGEVTVQDENPDPLVLEGVFLTSADIVPPCPTPTSGLSRLEGDGKEVVVDFATPGDGQVRVERGSKSSDSVDLCAYRSEIF